MWKHLNPILSDATGISNNIFDVFSWQFNQYPRSTQCHLGCLEMQQLLIVVFMLPHQTSVDATNYSVVCVCCLTGKDRDSHVQLPLSGHIISLKEIVHMCVFAVKAVSSGSVVSWSI